MTFLILNSLDVLILTMYAVMCKIFGLVTILFNNSINFIEANNGPTLSDASSYLDSLYERVRKALKDLEKFLRDYSARGRANVKALYEYLMGLLEEMIKMCPDWMSSAFAVAIALLITLIVMIIISRVSGIISREREIEWEREQQRIRGWSHSREMGEYAKRRRYPESGTTRRV